MKLTIDEFKLACATFLSKHKGQIEPIVYKTGDTVKTKSDSADSYISKVIGVGKKGTVISDCSIPLVDFGPKIGEFYICQNKLKSA